MPTALLAIDLSLHRPAKGAVLSGSSTTQLRSIGKGSGTAALAS